MQAPSSTFDGLIDEAVLQRAVELKERDMRLLAVLIANAMNGESDSMT